MLNSPSKNKKVRDFFEKDLSLVCRLATSKNSRLQNPKSTINVLRVGHAIPQKRECSHVKSFRVIPYVPTSREHLEYSKCPIPRIDQYLGETLICSVFYVIFLSYHFRVLSHLQLSLVL